MPSDKSWTALKPLEGGKKKGFCANEDSQCDAEWLFLEDIAHVIAALIRLIVVPLHQYQLDALISFVFNVGAGALQRSRLRQSVNRGHHALVPCEFMKWVHAHGKVLPGLVSRRTIEARLYQGFLPPDIFL